MSHFIKLTKLIINIVLMLVVTNLMVQIFLLVDLSMGLFLQTILKFKYVKLNI